MLRVSALLLGFAGLGAAGFVSAADIRGRIDIERKLTRANVTASAGIYQRGPSVELGSDGAEDPIAFERSHVAVYLEGAAEPSPEPPKPAIMEQKDRRFSPDLIVIPAGGSVSFPNFDPIFHNVFSLSKAKSFDLGNYPKGQTRIVRFPNSGIIAVYCHLHPNMSANIVVTPNRWNARVEASGNFALKDVLPGTYTVVAWHKTAGTFRKTLAVVAGKDAEVTFVLPEVEPATGASHLAHR